MNAPKDFDSVAKAMESMDNRSERSSRGVNVSAGRELTNKEQLRQELAQGKPGNWASDHREEVRQYKSWHFVCIESKSSQCSQAEVKARTRPKKKGSKLKAMSSEEKGEEFDYDHPLNKILRRPNPTQSGSSFRYEQAMQICITGSSLIWNVRNKFGKTTERYIIPTAIATPNGPNALYPYGYWKINPEGSRYQQAWLLGGLMNAIGYMIDARDMQVVRIPHPITKDDGLSTISAVAEWTDNSNNIDISRNASMQNGMKPSAIVTLEDDVHDEADFDAIVDKLNVRYAGAAKSGKLLVIEGKKAKVTKLSNTPHEMDYGVSHDQARNNILAAHKTPPIAVGIESPSGREGLYAPMEQYSFITIQPLLNMMADEDNEFWVWEFGEGAYVEYKAKSIKDADREMKEVDQLIAGQALKKNELRELRNWEPLEDEEGEKFVGEASAAETERQTQMQTQQMEAMKENKIGQQDGAAGADPWGQYQKVQNANQDKNKKEKESPSNRFKQLQNGSKAKSLLGSFMELAGQFISRFGENGGSEGVLDGIARLTNDLQKPDGSDFNSYAKGSRATKVGFADMNWIKSFASQVETSSGEGVKAIVRKADETGNGHAVWPLVGFDGDIPNVESLPTKLKSETRISGLLQTEEGRSWWRQNGTPVDLEFDLDEKSYSMSVLNAVLESV
jgi:phage portal protein BeeE